MLLEGKTQRPKMAQWAPRYPSLLDRLDEWAPWFHFRSPMSHWLAEWDDELAPMGDWIPPMDITESDGKMIVQAEVPGMDPKDIDVSIEDDRLIIRGSKEKESTEKEGDITRRERCWGKFARSVTLPAGVDASKLAAEYDHGVLKVTVPLPDGSEDKAKKKIEVKAKR